jgi:SOS-response transcriptional repressor LexA
MNTLPIFSLDDHRPFTASRYARLTASQLARSLRRQQLTLLPVDENFIASNLSDALTGEGINHSDQLHCLRVNRVESGELGVVNTPYGLMIRRYHVEENYIRLEAANPQFPTLFLPPQSVHIIGRPYKLVRDLTQESEVAA